MYTQAVIGFRSWHVSLTSENLISPVISRSKRTEWPIDGPVEAECVDTGLMQERVEGPHDHPTMGCVCGLRAWHTFDLALEHFSQGGFSIVGACLAWGKYVVASKGFKAQYMRPLALVDHLRADQRDLRWPKLLAKVEADYAVPVVPRDLIEQYAQTWGPPMGTDFTP